MQTTQTGASFMRTLTIIYIALSVGQLLFLFVASKVGGNLPELHQTLRIIAPIVASVAVLAGSFVYMMKMNQIKLEQRLSDKLSGYLVANLMRWALLEMGAMFCLVCYFLTGNIWYAYLFAAAFLPFLINRPSLDKCLRQLPLSEREKNILTSGEPIQ